MDGFGIFQGKLDIKILILFILRQLPGEVSGETLANLAQTDGNVGYFEFAECLSELIDTGHVEKTIVGYVITDKGRKNCETVETSLPFTSRKKLEKRIQPMAEIMRRKAMITAGHEVNAEGITVHLAVSDGVSDVLDLRILCGSDSDAQTMEKNFRDRAEQYYNDIMGMLLQK